MAYEDKRVEASLRRHAEIGIHGLAFIATNDYDRAGPDMQQAIRAASEQGIFAIRPVYLFGYNAGSLVWAGYPGQYEAMKPIPGFFEAQDNDRKGMRKV